MKLAYLGMLTFKGILALLCLSTSACVSTPTTSMKTAQHQGEVFRVGVIPFDNVTPNIKAGEDFARFCYSEMFRQLYHDYQTHIGPYRFEMEDEFRLKEIMHKNEWLDQTAHLDVGLPNMIDTLGVDLLLLGTVSEYHYKRGLGEDPVASLHLRLYDRKHNTVIWSGSHSKVGHFSWFKEDALGRLARQVAHELVARMLKELHEQIQFTLPVQNIYHPKAPPEPIAVLNEDNIGNNLNIDELTRPQQAAQNDAESTSSNDVQKQDESPLDMLNEVMNEPLESSVASPQEAL